ncbi:ApbE-like lipoprotein [Pseudomonas viridiflava]|uniref:FAD:protein FMN transferase n=2 Tax=Pseudomonas viridiflava TaxID=33069 RepID=A0A3M5P734_PSEVI|nr:ApbE-like lipoprotein [Pseudomonas viridiflava]
MDCYRLSERTRFYSLGHNVALADRQRDGACAGRSARRHTSCSTRAHTALLMVLTLRDMSLGWLGRVAGYLGLVVCSGCGQERSLESFGGPTMGSHYSVVYAHEAGQPGSEVLHREVDAVLGELDQQMSLWRTDSDIAQFNSLPANSCQTVPAPILELVRLGDYLARESNGAFDVTVEPLMELWGFSPDSVPREPPTRRELEGVRAQVGYQALRIDGQRLCKTADVRVDLNSIAAGYAVDRIGERLEALGLRDYLVQVNGELKTRGRKPDGSPWRVTLELPHNEHQAQQKVFALRNNSVSTSDDHSPVFGGARHQGSRTLDAVSGTPVNHGLVSVTVIHPSALMADGLSSLLLILGPERGWNYAQAHKIAAFFVIRADNRFIIRSNASFDLLSMERPL